MSAPLVLERSRSLLRVTGRDPVKMINGLATADVAAAAPEKGVYTAFLTPKGRMVADARVFRPDANASDLLIETAPDALSALVAHLARFVPPLFAKAEDVSDDWAVIGVYGEGADGVVAAVAGAAGAADQPPDAAAADVGEDAAAPDVAEDSVVPLDGGFRVRTLVTGDPGWDIFVSADRRDQIIEALLEAGGRPGDPAALDALRIAAGRPRWGRELTEDVIPLEAGLLDRAISQDKGCYTGQEVIVRILHRGHVNRHLRRLEFAGAIPEPGTELFEEGNEKSRGVVTSVAGNEAGVLGLGYVRREIDPPAELRVGAPDGDPVQVTSLD